MIPSHASVNGGNSKLILVSASARTGKLRKVSGPKILWALVYFFRLDEDHMLINIEPCRII